MVWSELDNCYKSRWVDNMGGAVLQDSNRRDGKLIAGGARVSMGQPVVFRSVITLAVDGSLGNVTEHTAYGAADPVQSFFGTYTKKK